MTTLLNVPIPCAQCGYDLRGTAMGGVCPECGLRVLATRGGLRVEGNRLIVRSGQVLPPRCIKTNEPLDNQPITRTLYWSHPAWLLLILVNLLVLLIVYFAVRKRCRITYFLSPQMRKRRQRWLLAWLCVWVAGIAVIVASVGMENGIIALVGVVTFLVGLIGLFACGNTLTITGHRDGEFWIKGCGPAFLAVLDAESRTPTLEF